MRNLLIRQLVAFAVAVVFARTLFSVYPALLNNRMIETTIITLLIFTAYQVASSNGISIQRFKNGVKQFGTGVLVNFGMTILAMSFLFANFWAIAFGDETFQRLFPNTETIPWLRLLTMALCVAITEETGLRGFLQDFLKAIKIPIWLIILLQGAVFAGPHTAYFTTNLASIFYYILIGMLFSIAAFHYGNLYWCIGFHFFWDFVQYICYGSRVFGTGGYLTAQTPNLLGVNYTQLIATFFAVSGIYFFAARMKNNGLGTTIEPSKLN